MSRLRTEYGQTLVFSLLDYLQILQLSPWLLRLRLYLDTITPSQETKGFQMSHQKPSQLLGIALRRYMSWNDELYFQRSGS